MYVGDYRTGLVFDRNGKVSGVEPEFLDYLDQLADVANRHGVTVMFSLTDNAMVNGRRAESIALLREGEASEAFVNNVLVEFVKKLKGRQVIWDIFNEPENVTTVPLRDIQRYVDRVLAAGRRADPHARFTVVSRSRPEIVYWQGRGLDLYSHNIFTERSLEESLAEPRGPGGSDHGGRDGSGIGFSEEPGRPAGSRVRGSRHLGLGNPGQVRVA